MKEFIFVNNGAGGGKDILDWFNFFVQFGVLFCTIITAFFAGYVVIKGQDIYKKQKKEDRKEHIRQIKLSVLKDFNGYKYNLKGEGFTKALNEIPIVFDDSESVILAWNNFHYILGQNYFDNKE